VLLFPVTLLSVFSLVQLLKLNYTKEICLLQQ
jgi:hypothetical protein